MVGQDPVIWFRAASLDSVEEEISKVHAGVAREVALHRPICLASGSCCRFDAFDHRLYVTGLEAARCLLICSREGRSIGAAQIEAARARGNCPWQDGRLCTAREGRPSGCRVFYCDPRAADWVPEIAEWAHARIKEIHDRHDIPYAYGEWRAMLDLAIPMMPEGAKVDVPGEFHVPARRPFVPITGIFQSAEGGERIVHRSDSSKSPG